MQKVASELPPILDAVRAFRRVLLPRAQAAVEGIVAAAEALGLKSPHREGIKALNPGGAGQSPRSLPTKKPEFPKKLNNINTELVRVEARINGGSYTDPEFGLVLPGHVATSFYPPAA